MDRLKKIRGQQRRKKNIEKWRLDSLPLDIELVNERHYEYVKVWVSPWDNLRYIARDYTGPKTDNRNLIFIALLDIYESWEIQLKKLGIPYYLKIWLFEPRVTSSQVVCGIEDRIEYYENVFSLATKKVQFPRERYKHLTNRIDLFNWTNAIDEEIIENDFWPKNQYFSESYYYADQRMFRRLEEKQIRSEDLSNEKKKLTRYYVPKGQVWIGGKK